MRKRIEERVPAIADIEKRKNELEDQASEKALEIKSLQDQLKDSIKKHAKVTSQLLNAEKRVKDLENEAKSNKERMQSIRKLN